MNFSAEYEENPLFSRPKALLTFSEVDNEFLSANNFVVLNLDNIEYAIPENTLNIESGNCELLQDIIPDKEDCDVEVYNQPTNLKRKKTPKHSKQPIQKIFPCDLCDEQFTLLKDLKFHKTTKHILSKLHKCQECFKEFNFEKNFMLHLATHTSTPAKCPQCETIFQRISSFIGHIDTHIDDDTFKCQDCDMQFEFEEYYERHIQKAHKDGGIITSNRVKKRRKGNTMNKNNGKYMCKVCGKCFPKPSLLTRHEVAHSKTKPFECLECRQRFSQKSSLDRHSLLHNGIKPFDCPHCNLSFTQRTNLVTHMNRVHPPEKDLENTFQCNKCTCVFRKLKSLNRHITLVHSTENLLTVNGDDNLSISDLLEHIKSFQSDNPKQQQLDKLGFHVNENIPAKESPPVKSIKVQNEIDQDEFDINRPNTSESFSYKLNDESELENNFNEIENSPKEISECVPQKASNIQQVHYLNLVDKSSNSEENFNFLVKEIDIDGIKWLECLYCSKRFQRKFDILRHTRMHTRLKPYVCEICGSNFALKHTLNRHMKIHKKNPSGITKIYQCTICQKRFNSLRSMDLHVWIHNDSAPHRCPICFKQFRSLKALTKHKETHESNNPDQDKVNYLSEILEEVKEQSPLENDEEHIYQCSRCGLKFKTSFYLKKHEESHLGLKTFQCLACQRKFSSKNDLQNHQKIHFNCKTIKCNECTEVFFTNCDLKKHKTKHSTAKNFACPYCSKTFKMKETCMQHLSTHFKGIREESPEELVSENVKSTVVESFENESESIPCDYILIFDEPNSENLENLNLTLQQSNDLLFLDMPENDIVEENGHNFNDTIKTSINELQNSMKVNSEFINIEDLQNTKNHLSKNIVVMSHEKAINNSDRILSKNSNSQEFLFQEARDKIAENDKRNTNKKKPPHICSVCKKIFKKPIDLRRHIRTHTKEKPFQCNICSKAFSLKCTLDDHKLIHQKDRPTFTCHVCGKNYATKNVLNTHLRLHTGERPYKCEICLKTFRTSGHRIVHRRIHSKEKIDAARKKKK